MKNSGKAMNAALRLIMWTLLWLVAIFAAGILARLLGSLIAGVSTALIALWILFAASTLYFFRDPDANPPSDPKAIVAPAHGKVDVIDEIDEPAFMGGRCRRISIFLSIFDVHVQNAPVSGKVTHVTENAGQFLNAMRPDCAQVNENVLIGIVPAGRSKDRVGVRLIAGLIARRIKRWVNVGEELERSDRISLIQFGSRVELYLPLSARVRAELGAKVKGGETVVATLP